MFRHHKDLSIPSQGNRQPNPIQRLLERLRALGAALPPDRLGRAGRTVGARRTSPDGEVVRSGPRSL